MEWVSSFQDFMDKGGIVLWPILILTICLWWLMLERFWYFFREHNDVVQHYRQLWSQRRDHSSWFALKQRRQFISEMDCRMLKNLKLIPTLIALLPMFGLMGTVNGMIQVFDVMAFLGSGNPRAMADGVSAATIPTMAGMVVAIIAIPFATTLDRRYQREARVLHSLLPREG